MRQILEESGMRILYQDDACYRIEKSALVAKLQGVKIVEFVQADNKKCITVLEAKTTAPCQDNKEDYDNYVREICEKFQNSILLINAAKMGRRAKIFMELPQPLQKMDYKSATYRLIFIIKNSLPDWVSNLRDDLRCRLRPFLKCWNISTDQFIVLNEQLAREMGVVE